MRWHRFAAEPLIRAAGLILLVGGATVQASAIDSRTPREYLAVFDLDGDGRVSLLEYQDHLMLAAVDMDRNGDGLLDRSELPPGTRLRDGRPVRLSKQREAIARRFRLQDRNGDHYLDAAELAAPMR